MNSSFLDDISNKERPITWVKLVFDLQSNFEASDLLYTISGLGAGQYASKKKRAQWLSRVSGACVSSAENWLDGNSHPNFTATLQIFSHLMDLIGEYPMKFKEFVEALK